MKFFIAFIIALIVSVLLKLTDIDLFLTDWFSCTSFFTTILLYNYAKERSNEREDIKDN